MIKYLGSKRVFVPVLGKLAELSGASTAVDLFTGTTRVAQEFCRRGLWTYAADIASYSYAFANTYVAMDAAEAPVDQLSDELAYLNSLPPTDGYFSQTFSRESRFFQLHNSMRVDSIRQAIEDNYKGTDLYYPLLTSLIEAADAVDSTVGIHMAYLKKWADRSYKNMVMKMPKFTPGKGMAIQGDVFDTINSIDHVGLAYIDPPYNSRQYFNHYHIWETLVRWDKPQHYGVACKRIDAKDESTSSVFNRKKKMPDALAKVVNQVKADTVVLSFSNEGFVPLDDLVDMCKSRGDHVEVLSFEHRRYIGYAIGGSHAKNPRPDKPKVANNVEYVILSGEKEKVKRMKENVVE